MAEFSLTFDGARVTLSPSKSVANPKDLRAKFAVTAVRHFPDGHVEAELRNFTGKIVIAAEEPCLPIAAAKAKGSAMEEEVGAKAGTAKAEPKGPLRKTKSFVDKVSELSAYKRDHGNLDVTHAYNSELATFCAKVRQARRNPEKSGLKLTPDRIAALDALEFDWDAGQSQRRKLEFFDKLEKLRAYKERRGHTHVKGRENKRLASFVSNLRWARKNPEKSRLALTKDRIQLLDDLGFAWENDDKPPPPDPFAKSFLKRLDRLRKFKEEHGHLDVTQKNGGAGLQKFCAQVRKAKVGAEGDDTVKLAEEHVAALDELGFDWSEKPRFRTFAERLEDLKEYREAHGHLDVSKMVRKDHQSLHDFCNNLIYARNHPGKGFTTMNEERVARLDEIGFEWGDPDRPKKDPFGERLEELKRYREARGHLNVEKAHDESLFVWCAKMRCARNKPSKMVKLTEDRVAALDALGFPWTTKYVPFRERVKALKRRYEASGTDFKRKDDPSLFEFCKNVRFARSHPGRGLKLTDDRVAALDAIGFPWHGSARLNRGAEVFEKRMGELRAFKEEHGHLTVPAREYPVLAKFCVKVRNSSVGEGGEGYNLTEENIASLEELGFDW